MQWDNGIHLMQWLNFFDIFEPSCHSYPPGNGHISCPKALIIPFPKMGYENSLPGGSPVVLFFCNPLGSDQLSETENGFMETKYLAFRFGDEGHPLLIL